MLSHKEGRVEEQSETVEGRGVQSLRTRIGVVGGELITEE